MQCLYCDKEVPLRMRLTGEEHFCSPEHKRLYQEEHSRLGLARLLEEVTARSEGPPGNNRPDPTTGNDGAAASEVLALTPVGTAEEPPQGAGLPEPELTASGNGLKLWKHSEAQAALHPVYVEFLKLDLPPAEYVPAAAPAAKEPAVEVKPEMTAAVAPAATATGPGEAPPPRPVSSASPNRKAAEIPSPERKPAVKADPLPEPPRRQDTVRKAEPKTEEAAGSVAPAAMFTFGNPRYAKPPSGRQQSAMAVRIAAGAVIAIALGAGAYWGISTGQFGSGGGEAAARVGGGAVAGAVAGEWIPNWSSDQQGQEIALFGPSQEWSDYRVQWQAQTNQGVAWVFRASDPNNYYVVRLERAPDSNLRLVRYAVIGGAATTRSEEPLRASSAVNEGYDVQLEVDGAEFTLYLDGHNVARWSDHQLRRGGFGIIRHDLGLAGVNDVKVVQLQRNSAFRGRFWTGDPPENLPEVTLIRSSGSRPSPGNTNKPGAESSL